LIKYANHCWRFGAETQTGRDAMIIVNASDINFTQQSRAPDLSLQVAKALLFEGFLNTAACVVGRLPGCARPFVQTNEVPAVACI
jgi:hypothetical protein